MSLRANAFALKWEEEACLRLPLFEKAYDSISEMISGFIGGSLLSLNAKGVAIIGEKEKRLGWILERYRGCY